MKSKFLSKEEQEEFLSFCDKLKIRQREMAEICCDYPSVFSKAIANNRFRRAYAKLIYLEKKLEKKEEVKKDFDLEI